MAKKIRLAFIGTYPEVSRIFMQITAEMGSKDEHELEMQWFKNKKVCGVSAGASTPDWIINNVVNQIKAIDT